MRRAHHHPCRGGRSGSVLILALWTLFFLAALAVAIGAQVSAGLRQAMVLRDDLEAYATARAGVATTLAVIVADTNGWDAASDEWGAAGALGQSIAVAHGTVEVMHTALGFDGTVVTNRGVIDEESCISINRAGQALLVSLFEIIGRMRESEASAAAAAIVDWRDGNDDELTGGAENHYYSTLGEGYTCHDGDFQALEELCLVKGCSRELLDRIRPAVTLHGSGKINVNTASPAVLRCLADRHGGEKDVIESVVDTIVAFRESGGVFESGGDAIVEALSEFREMESDSRVLLRSMRKSMQVDSDYFRGTVRSSVAGSPAGEWAIDFAFDRERQEKVYWYER